jgi:hypothetical protein
MADSLTQVIVLAAAGFIVLVVLGWVWARRREAAAVAVRRAASRQLQTRRQQEQRERAELARKIIATSSSATIAGFEVVRQIEAVFVDGQGGSAEAVEALKALAAGKGANAIINLVGARLPSGKCSAHGDAVVVRPAAGEEPGLEEIAGDDDG